MTKRKTFDVETLRHIVNDVLANMAGDSVSEKQYRKGMMFLLEDVLHETGNYRGFQYLSSASVPNFCKPGTRATLASVVKYKDGQPHPNYDERFKDTDETRVVYL
jgi:hypothetical protein